MDGRSVVAGAGAVILALAAFLLLGRGPAFGEGAGEVPAPPLPRADGIRDAVPNDNRRPGGTLRRRRLEIELEAVPAAWRPDADVDSLVTVQAFAEVGGSPRIPGPLIRVVQGTEIRVSVRNTFDSPLVIHGLRAGTVEADTLHVGPGGTREVAFRADRPGTFLYWGTTTGAGIRERWGRDSQLTGAIVIDPPGAAAGDRVFVLTLIDIYSDPSRPPTEEDIWELAINGLSWPHTERLEYAVGDTVRWRLVNGTDRLHPMHLHGFHYDALAKGDGVSDTTYTADRRRLGVTEFMAPGSTFRMAWVPTRAGNWLVHCHMLPHIRPYPPRDSAVQEHDIHDVMRHPLQGMAGLVLGVSVVERDVPAARKPDAPRRRLRLLVQQGRVARGPAARRYVLQLGDEDPRPDSVTAPSSTIVLTRDEPVAITVVNRMADATSVHWHGMELESYYDGVSGWSGADALRAPLISPGDSFTVHFTPPRAGTYMYHTHMDEGDQLVSGLYAPLLVLEPGEVWDPATDLTLLIGDVTEAGEPGTAINGRLIRFDAGGDYFTSPLVLQAGRSHRLRFMNMGFAEPLDLLMNADPAGGWVHIAKDGADLPPSLRVPADRSLRVGVGEAWDFEWTPPRPGEAWITIRHPLGTYRVHQRVVVLAASH